ncbi:ABC transporter substrate-binding protein [Yinghuangia aomiensis]
MPRPSRRTSVRFTRKSHASAAAALVLVLAAVSGCGAGNGESLKASAGATPRPGGTMTVVTVSDPTGLDPFRMVNAFPTDGIRLSALYDPLFWVDGNNRVVPQLGESLTSPDAGTTWVLKLRPGVTFSDGTAFDAAAVKYTWDKHADPATRSVVRNAATGLRTEAVDPLTLKITLPEPNNAFDRTVATELAYVGSPTAMQKDFRAFSEHPVGAGPFVVKEWLRGNKLVLKKNPTYWQGPRRPYLDELDIKVLPDIQQQLNTIEVGDADLMLTSDPARTKDAQEAKLGVVQTTANFGHAVVFNLRRAPFDDPRARRAVALAVNPDELNRVLYNGTGTPARGVFAAGSPFFDPASSQPAHDRAQAQKLFDELAAEGRPVTFTLVIPQNPATVKAAEFLQSRLQQYKGVTVHVEPLEISAYSVRTAINRELRRHALPELDIRPGTAHDLADRQRQHPEPRRLLLPGRGPGTHHRPHQCRPAGTRPGLPPAAGHPRAGPAVLGLPGIARSRRVRPRVSGVQTFTDGGILPDRIGFA